MEELVKLVAQKTGMPEAQAQTAVETVLGYLKERLPAPLASQLDAVIGNGAAIQGAEDALKNLGGLFGKK